MKNLISIAILIISLSSYGQKTKEVEVSKFDTVYNNITVDGVTYKCMQFSHFEKDEYIDGDNYMKKSIRIKPLGSPFFSNNLSLCYWVSPSGKTTIKIQEHPLLMKFKKYETKD